MKVGIAAVIGLLALAAPGAASAATSMAVQTDGKIVVVGTYLPQAPAQPGPSAGIVLRLLPNGTPDLGFGAGGAVVDYRAEVSGPLAPFTRGTLGRTYRRTYEGAVAVQSDGRILAAFGGSDDVRLFRYLADGTPDQSFGVSGSVLVSPAGQGEVARFVNPVAILTRPDGTIAVVSGGGASNRYQVESLAGSIKVFGSDGTKLGLTTWIGNSALEGAIGLTGGSLLVAAGHAEIRGAVPPRHESLEVTKFLPGTPPAQDTGFGTGEWSARPTFFEAATEPGFAAAVVASGTDLLTVGEASPGVNQAPQALLARLSADGKPEPAFGEGGYVLLPRKGAGLIEPTDAGPGTGGGIVVAGGIKDPSSLQQLAMARFLGDGKADSGFGTAGLAVATTAGAPVLAQPLSAAVLPDGGALVNGRLTGGSSIKPGNPPFVLARFNSAGKPVAGFGAQGTAFVTPCEGTNGAECHGASGARLFSRVGRHHRPTLRMRVEPTELTDPLVRARMILPPGLRMNLDRMKPLVRIPGGSQSAPTIRPLRVDASATEPPRAIEFKLGPGLIKPLSHRRKPHRFKIRVQAWTASGELEKFVFQRRLR